MTAFVVGCIIGGCIAAATVALRCRAGSARRNDDLAVGIDASVLLRAEMERARRYGRRFVLVRIGPDALDRSRDRDAIVASVTPLLRGLDHCWFDDAGLHLLLPEVGRPAAGVCLDRLRDQVDGVDVADARVAVFPDDAVTIGALSLCLEGADEALPRGDELPTSIHGGARAS